ncbi:MAG: hypothetical protein WKF75_00415 [Singulisphaera sp.]
MLRTREYATAPRTREYADAPGRTTIDRLTANAVRRDLTLSVGLRRQIAAETRMGKASKLSPAVLAKLRADAAAADARLKKLVTWRVGKGLRHI